MYEELKIFCVNKKKSRGGGSGWVVGPVGGREWEGPVGGNKTTQRQDNSPTRLLRQFTDRF